VAVNRRLVEVVESRADWIACYERERALLEHALGRALTKAHHIGSTAVPGLAAKPIIDILLEVSDLDSLDARDHQMVALGYTVKGEHGIVGRRYFQKGGALRTHHVHAYQVGDDTITRHLAFRDYLIANGDVAEEYAELKRGLARTFRNDPAKYQAGKAAFLETHQERAVGWYQRRGC
jgi:GrpB-like predicted nucleotidyltransferase (UPF0157 family)